MAHVVKRKGVQHGKPYEVRWSWYDDEGERRFGQERFARAHEAKAKKREVEQAVADAHLFDTSAGKQTFAEWAERWYTVHSPSIKPSTARSYRSLLDKSVLPAFGRRRIRSVSTADIQAFVLALHSRGLTPSTIRHHYGTVRLVLAEAARNKAITVNPALDVKLPTDRSTGRAKVEPHFLSPEEVARLAAACEHRTDCLCVSWSTRGCGAVRLLA